MEILLSTLISIRTLKDDDTEQREKNTYSKNLSS